MFEGTCYFFDESFVSLTSSSFCFRSESVLLAYARKRLEQLTQQLATFQVEEQKRLENSLKVQKEEDSKLTDLKVKQETERMAAEFQTKLRTKVRTGLEFLFF